MPVKTIITLKLPLPKKFFKFSENRFDKKCKGILLVVKSDATISKSNLALSRKQSYSYVYT